MTKDKALNLALEALKVATTPLAKDRQEVLRASTAIKEALAQPPEPRNFCPRCGKRTRDLTVIHTCTPPQEGA